MAASAIGVLAALGGVAPALAAAQADEQIASFKIDAEIQPDGALTVTELITYDFGDNERHGIEREIDVREPADEDNDRVYALSGVTVSSPTGAPAGVRLIHNARSTTIRVGDPDLTVTGRQQYQLQYTLRGLMNSFDEHDELFWEATGTRWRVSLLDVTVTVRTPGGLRQVSCFAGESSSQASCDQQQAVDQQQAAFGQGSLQVGEGLTVVIGLDKGVVAVPPPVLEAVQRGPWEAPPSRLSYLVAGLSVVGAATIGGLLWLRGGRDRTYLGVPLGLAPAPGQASAEDFVPVTGGPEPAVAFTPPKGVRPALVGLVLAERTTPVQISATIVDLAVRGYLRIDELGGGDWSLTWLGQQGPDDQLAPYEQTLLDSLFEGRPTVTLASLRRKFQTSFRRVSRELADEGYRAGWFRRRPRVTASSGSPRQLLGCLMPLLFLPISFSGVGSALALIDAGWSTVVVVFGLLLAVVIGYLVWRAMPARTALGRAVWAQTMGFRRYLATAEADQLRHEEATEVFSRYLPLAMIFGLTKRWAKVFAALAAAQGTVATVWWYGGGDPSGLGPSLDSFGRSSGSVLSSAPASSSAGGGSGFSSSGSVGGGSSGGGGGSW